MNDAFINFDEKRMYIFSELVRRYWNGTLNQTVDLEELAREISEKYGFAEDEVSFIKDHIRLAMGLSPNGNSRFEEELDMMRSGRKMEKPIVSKVEGPCAFCGKRQCRCDTLGKYESTLYLRDGGCGGIR